mgnify:CR=1 FL=1
MAEGTSIPRQRAKTPPASSQAARAIMRANHGRDTGPELALRRILHAQGLRYRVDYPLPFDRRRRADVAFTRARVAVFVDGCFWHGCPIHGTTPRTNTDFWADKIARNRARDDDTTSRLHAAGWSVLRFWEHEEPHHAAGCVARAVARALALSAECP